MTRRGGRDLYRPRELRGVSGKPSPGPAVLAPPPPTPGVTPPRGAVLCHHNVAWKNCTVCSRPR